MAPSTHDPCPFSVRRGVPVRASWLEEETLAYVRRDRLQRAALCLPYCRRERLLALLRGQQPTNVI